MSEHTPGPWYSWLPKDCDSGCRTIRTEKGRARGSYHGTEIAFTNGLANDSEDEANACLIANAPDMAAEIDRLRAANGELLSACRTILREPVGNDAYLEAWAELIELTAKEREKTDE